MPEIKVSPKPAIQPYTASADAAPRPDTSPAARPCASVRRMHSTPIGPTGAAIEKPISNPFSSKPAFIAPSYLLDKEKGRWGDTELEIPLVSLSPCPLITPSHPPGA